jgi:hypothetical protein
MKILADSYIHGSFRGWKGRTIYKLDNGQYWKQKIYAYYYQYAYHPRAIIWEDGSRYFLEVQGVNQKLEVVKASSGDWEDYQKEEGE